MYLTSIIIKAILWRLQSYSLPDFCLHIWIHSPSWQSVLTFYGPFHWTDHLGVSSCLRLFQGIFSYLLCLLLHFLTCIGIEVYFPFIQTWLHGIYWCWIHSSKYNCITYTITAVAVVSTVIIATFTANTVNDISTTTTVTILFFFYFFFTFIFIFL